MDKIDAIEVTLTKKSSQVDDVINTYTKQYKEEKSINVLKDNEIVYTFESYADLDDILNCSCK